MLPASIDKMLENMMMQMFNTTQNATEGCCSKMKRKCQRCSRTCCMCQKNKKRKKRHKLKKSCLKTIVCLSKVAKDGGNHGCSRDPTRGNNEILANDVDERFCSKCGQLLPGEVSSGQTSKHLDDCVQQLRRCQQDCKDVGVQACDERKEPLSVRIKVCPCPNICSTSHEERLHRTVSLPELSSSNPRLVPDASYNVRAPFTRFVDGDNDSRQSRPPSMRGKEISPDWPVDVASMKRLALNLAKARLVEEAARWERDQARRHVQQYMNEYEQPIHNGIQQHPTAFGESQRQVVSSQPRLNNGGKGNSNLNYNPTQDMDVADPGTTDFNVSPQMQDVASNCCDTNVYYYTPENGLSPFGDHCNHACTCGNSTQYQPFESPGYFGYPHQMMPNLQAYVEQ